MLETSVVVEDIKVFFISLLRMSRSVSMFVIIVASSVVLETVFVTEKPEVALFFSVVIWFVVVV